MPYSTCARCADLIPNILDGASDFNNLGSQIRPTCDALIRFMSSGCALIETKLYSLGYTPATGTAMDDFLADLESLYVAFRAEQVRGSPRTAQGERTRADMFRRAFDDGLKQLESMDLTRLGLAHDARWYVGGISESERDSVQSDTDRVDPRFGRGQFDNPDTGAGITSACR